MPWTRRFKNEMLSIFGDSEKIIRLLNKPITKDMCVDTNVLTLFCDRILMWPTYDIRYQGFSSDTQLLEDIARGMETSIVRKDIPSGIVEVAVDVQTNLDAFEKYNLLVQQHNEQWEKNGRPTQIIDPVHGDIYPVRDQKLDPALISSRCCPAPGCKINDYEQSGELAKLKPNLERRTYAKVTYQVTLTDSGFRLGYAAYNKKNEIVYYNEQSHNDLAVLIRKSIQEIWGNPNISRSSGPLLEGISLLTQGRKLSICRRDNKLPNFLRSEEVLASPREVESIEGMQKVYGFSNKLFGYGVPILSFFIGFLIFCQLVSGIANENLKGGLILSEIVVIIGLVIASRFLSRWSERQVSVMDARKTLI